MAKRPRLAANMQTSPGTPVRADEPPHVPAVTRPYKARTPEALLAEVAAAFVADAHPAAPPVHAQAAVGPLAMTTPPAPTEPPAPVAPPAPTEPPAPTASKASTAPPARHSAPAPAAAPLPADTLPAILGDAMLAMSQASLDSLRQAMALQARLSAMLMTPPRFPRW